MIKIEDKDDDNEFEWLKENSKFKISWNLSCLTTLDAMLMCFTI